MTFKKPEVSSHGMLWAKAKDNAIMFKQYSF